MKIKTHKQLYILLTIISLLIAGIVSFFLKNNNLPYTFKLDKKELRGEINKAIIYNDLDFDGKSERISLASAFQKSDNKKTSNDNIAIFNSNDVLIDQYNLFSYSSPEWLHFEDYNNDNYKEIFAFSQLNDSLFLTIINAKTRSYILHRQFILEKPDSAKKDFWDIWVQAEGLLNVDDDKRKEFIFDIVGAYSIYPRGIYSYDIEDKKIQNKFESGSLIHISEFGDLTNNQTQEIITNSVATGNMHKKIGYHDFANWLFVFDKNLTPIFTPKKIGSYPGRISTNMIGKGNNKKLFVINHELKNSKEISTALLFNPKGQIIDTLKNLPINISGTFKTVEGNNNYIYLTTKSGDLLKLNDQLQIIISKHYLPKTLFLISEIKYDPIQPKVIFSSDTDYNIYIFDKYLKTLAKYNFNSIFNYFNNHYSTKYNGAEKLPQLAIVSTKHNYLFTIVENKIYTYLPLIFIGTFFLAFLLVGYLHIVFSFISTYIKYFSYTLNKSSSGIALLNSSGRICYNNNNIVNYLNLNSTRIKKEHYKNIFKNCKDVLSAISYSFASKERIQKDIHISTHSYQFEGIVTITPFTSFIGFTPSYLMEITDFTAPLLTDRGKVWGATLQRIAHEIKTPLSTLILSLENLKSKLVEKDHQLNDEINIMQGELERIKQLTKNFMIFTNLEIPKSVNISISKILQEAINNFRSYITKGITLKYSENNLHVIGDQKQLSQLFSLIIENAIDACDGKGTIGVKTEEWEQESEKPSIRITISDNGKGMDKETLQKIFEPYFTTKKDGTGLGLSLVKKIIEDSRGKIEIKSELNKGTIVIIYLPKAD